MFELIDVDMMTMVAGSNHGNKKKTKGEENSVHDYHRQRQFFYSITLCSCTLVQYWYVRERERTSFSLFFFSSLSVCSSFSFWLSSLAKVLVCASLFSSCVDQLQAHIGSKQKHHIHTFVHRYTSSSSDSDGERVRESKALGEEIYSQ